MKDRTPRHPGRVRLTPTGEPNVFDITREDDPVEAGTPLNKATFLKDQTAALLSLSGDPTVDDALNALKSLVDGAITLTNTKAKIETGSYVGTGAYGVSSPNSITFGFVPKFVMVWIDQSSTAVAAVGGIFNTTNTDYGNAAHGFLVISNISSNSNYTFSKVSGNALYWYNSNNAGAQLNTAGVTYHYVAIG